MMRLLYPISEALPDPKARFIQIVQTSWALARKGCRVDLICGRGPASPSEILDYYGLKPLPDLHLHPLPLWRPGPSSPIRFSWNGIFHFFALGKILALSRTRTYQALYLRHLKLASFLLRFRTLIPPPFFFEIHELFHQTTEDPGQTRRLKGMESRVYGQAAVLLPLTGPLKSEVEGRFHPPGRVEVLPSGVDLNWPPPPDSWREEKALVYIGQFYPWKGVETAVQALSFLPEFHLHLIGGTSKSQKPLKDLADREGVGARVHFYGQIAPNQVKSYFFKGTVAVLPFLSGPYDQATSPLKLFEYMAAGLPIVASDIPAFREVLQDGVNALLVPPGDARGLAQGIERIYGDRVLRERLVRAARNAVQAYSWEARAQKIIDLIEGMDNRRPMPYSILR